MLTIAKRKYVLPWKFAEMHGKSIRQVFRMVESGRIPGVRKEMIENRKTWLIPAESEWPRDGRNKINTTGEVYLDDSG